MEPLTLDDIRAAADVIASEAVVTPVLRSDRLDELTGATVLAKFEGAQRAGSFKFRGAFHRLSRIPADERSQGVVAVSSGNHGAAVACAAQVLGIPATVFIPADAPTSKRALIEEYGAAIQTFERYTSDREAGARAHATQTGATFVHPYEDPLVMMGQGTCALELHEQVRHLDALVVPMSGGGLMAGCASAMHALDPSCEMVGVEPATADDTRRSFAAGERVAIDPPTTMADGLAVPIPGENTWSINSRLVTRILTVAEDEITVAMALAEEHLDVRLEPSGAVGIAALVGSRSTFAGRRVGVVLSGANIDKVRWSELVKE